MCFSRQPKMMAHGAWSSWRSRKPYRVAVTPLLVFALLQFSQLFSQSFSVTGSVYATHEETLPAATVSLLKPDSTVVASALTDLDGEWQLSVNSSQKRYILKVSYIGFETLYRNVDITQSSTLDVGKLILKPVSIQLEEVTVTQEREPVIINGDTVQYNTESYQMRRFAKLSELLKRLPGLEVGGDGTITVNGEPLTRVFVGGREISGPALLVYLQSLPAEAIKNIKIFDDYREDRITSSSDFASKGMSLQIQDEFLQATFGSFSTGVGTSGRYHGDAMLNSFKPERQLSLVAKSNNMNDLQLLGDDLTTSEQSTASPGISTTHTGGFNMIQNVSDKMVLSTNYTANFQNTDIDKQLFQRTFFPEGTLSVVQNDSQSSQTGTHIATVGLNVNDSINTLRLNATGTMINAESAGITNRFLSADYITPVAYRNEVDLFANLNNTSINLSGHYKHNFKKTGRSIILNVEAGFFGNELGNRSNNRIDYINQEDRSFEQGSLQRSEAVSYGGSFRYSEPISKFQRLNLTYVVAKRSSESRRSVLSGDEQFLPDFESDVLSDFDFHQAGLDHQFANKKLRTVIGVNVQRALLHRSEPFDQFKLKQTFDNVLPHASLSWMINMYSRVKLQYRTSVREPAAREILPVQPPDNSLIRYLQNVRLVPEYVHELRANLHQLSKRRKGLYFSITSSLRYSGNAITPAISIGDDLIQKIKYVNASQDFRASALVQLGLPVKKLRSEVKASVLGSGNRFATLLNDRTSFVDQYNYGYSFQYQYIHKSSSTFTLAASRSDVQLLTQDNGQTATQGVYQALGLLNLTERLSISSSFYYYVFDLVDDTNRAIPMLNTAISLSLFKRRNGQLRFSGINTLNEQLNASQSAQNNYVEHIVYRNSVGSVYLISFTLNVGKQARE